MHIDEFKRKMSMLLNSCRDSNGAAKFRNVGIHPEDYRQMIEEQGGGFSEMRFFYQTVDQVNIQDDNSSLQSIPTHTMHAYTPIPNSRVPIGKLLAMIEI